MNNPPAFPRPYPTNKIPLEDLPSVMRDCKGMTLRDYFAAAAMQGIIANPYTGEQMHKSEIPKDEQAIFIVRNSYALADAMLKAREK